jgi:hypothetical protein
MRLTHTCALAVGGRLDCSDAQVRFPQVTTGTVRGVQGDTLVFTPWPGGASVSVPLASVNQIEIQKRGSAWTRGALVGSIVGGLAGMISAVVFVSEFCLFDCPADPTGGEVLQAAALGGGVGAAGGFVLGALIAAPFSKRSWSTVYDGPPTLGLGVSLGQRNDYRLTATVSLSF